MDKVRENRMRRVAERQRLQLVKSRPREGQPSGYMLVSDDGRPVAGGNPAFSLSLDAVERFLSSPIKRSRAK
jgi:hypothetical protein